MARYNTFKYGGAKYGTSGLTTLLWALLIDWNNDGVSAEVNESGRLRSFTITRGRDGLFSSDPSGEGRLARMQVGECRLVMDNHDRRYDPWYAGALNPNVMPGRDVNLWVRNGSGGTDYHLFRGRIDDIQPQRHVSDPTAMIVASDGWRLLSDQRSTVALQTDATSDDLIGAALDDASWPSAWGRSLDVGSDTIPYAWINDQSAFDAIHDVCESEMGLGYVAADGKFYFKSRQNLEIEASALTLLQGEVSNEPQVNNPWEAVKNKIAVKAFPRALAALGEIWRLDETPSIAPGQSRTIWGTFRDQNYNETIAQDVAAPVATTDYTMNTEAGGGGSDLTGNFTVTATIFAGSVKLVVTNGGSVDGYVTLLKIRGKPLELLNVSAAISENSASQTAYGKRELTLELPFQQQADVAEDMADWLLTWMKDPLPTCVVEIRGRPTIQFAYDLGTYLTYTSAYLGINHRFRIAKIVHESKTMQDIVTRWTLEPVDQVTAYWQLGTVGFSELGVTTRLGY